MLLLVSKCETCGMLAKLQPSDESFVENGFPRKSELPIKVGKGLFKESLIYEVSNCGLGCPKEM